jgi:hypothetical protein
MLVIKILGAANGLSTRADGLYVKTFDPDAYNGRGHLVTTEDPSTAMTFANAAVAHDFWRQQSRSFPTRGDGQPNRPLTAYHIQMEKV